MQTNRSKRYIGHDLYEWDMSEDYNYGTYKVLLTIVDQRLQFMLNYNCNYIISIMLPLMILYYQLISPNYDISIFYTR